MTMWLRYTIPEASWVDVRAYLLGLNHAGAVGVYMIVEQMQSRKGARKFDVEMDLQISSLRRKIDEQMTQNYFALPEKKKRKVE